MSVAVVGAGIIGLSCAVEIQRREPRCKVTLIADQLSPSTVSDIAAGYWHPVCVNHDDKDLLKSLGQVTFDHIRQLCLEDSTKYGAGYQSGYELFDRKIEIPAWTDTVLNFRCVGKREREQMGWLGYEDCFFFTTCYLEPSKYLDFLMAEFKRKNGVVVEQKINSFEDIGPNYDCIVNATGLGSYWLCNDKSCFPIRGQVYKVKAPFQKHFIRSENNYILLNNDQVILGGCHQENNWDTKCDPTDSKKIWDGCLKLVPSIKDCKVISESVGLRPGRTTLRMQNEMMKIGGKDKTVIHCYGHGGSGVTLFQGCANKVAETCKNILLTSYAKM